MHYLRDVWVNWFEGEENGYNICPFHEWKSEDQIEVLDQVVVLKVTARLFDYLENHLEELPEDVLRAVYQKSILRKNMSRMTLDYCFIATDGEGTIVVDTLGYRTPIRKSRLIPRHEQSVMELLEKEEMSIYDMDRDVPKKEYHILSPHPQLMAGLTRKERHLKQLLLMALDELQTSENGAETRYWLTEWEPSKYEEIQTLSQQDAWQQLYDAIKYGWSKRHYELCERMVKGNPFFEKLWNMQHEEKVN